MGVKGQVANPAVSAEQYGLAQAVLHGRLRKQSGMTKAAAKELIEKTPRHMRVMYAKQLAAQRRTGNTKSKQGPVGEAMGKLSGVGKLATKGPVSEAMGTFGRTASWADRQFGKLIGHNPKDWSLYEASKKADDEFQAELEKVFGSKAGDMRYRPKSHTPAIRRAAEKKHKADEAWLKEMRKKNPEADAAAMYESFTGFPSESTEEYVIEEKYHSNLADGGDLLGFKVRTISGYDATIEFDDVEMGLNEMGTQIYAVGGSQELDLKALHINANGKDSLVIGEVWAICYGTEKSFDDGYMEYVHTFGPEEDQERMKKDEDLWEDARPPADEVFGTGELPTLRYDCMNDTVHLDGGDYKIEKPLFETSPGIVG